MEPTKKEPTFEESIKQVMQALPPVIRDYLTQGKYTAVAQNLMAKYGLRIDQGGVLEREIMLLLMGVETPDEFIQSLATDANLNKQAVDGIVQDVNDQIFVPLREAEKKSGVAPAVTPAEPETHFHLENKIPAPSAIPKLVPPPRPFTPAGPSARPALRDVLSAVMKTPNNRMLEDHEEPHIEFKKAPTPAQPRPSAPPANLPKAVPQGVIPPGARPVFTPAPNIVSRAAIIPPPVPPRPAAPVVPKPAMPAVPTPPKPAIPPVPTAPSAPAKPYAGDPYREPIEP